MPKPVIPGTRRAADRIDIAEHKAYKLARMRELAPEVLAARTAALEANIAAEKARNDALQAEITANGVRLGALEFRINALERRP